MNTAAPVLTPRPKGKTPTIYTIKYAQPEGSPFFSRSSMKFFGQTLKCFSVSWDSELGAWKTTAGMWDHSGRFMGVSAHYWHRETLAHLGTKAAVRSRGV